MYDGDFMELIRFSQDASASQVGLPNLAPDHCIPNFPYNMESNKTKNSIYLSSKI